MIRNLIGLLCGLVLTIIFSALILPALRKLKASQSILHYVEEHKQKQGTPTMGGIAFICAFTIVSILMLKSNSRLAMVSIAVTVGYGIIGFLDDYIKIKLKRNEGLSSVQKIASQLLIAIITAVFAYREVLIDGIVWIPFLNQEISLGWLSIPLITIIFLACTNGVNLTDGLDGLSSSTTLVFFISLSVLLMCRCNYFESVGDTILLSQTNNIILLCMIMVGCLIGFLLFNCYPAKMFMGDTGSLALGGLVASTAIFTRMSFVIPLIGVAFLISCASVIIQVLYFKATKGKRIFNMAPYHHHLQKKGFSEVRISVMYSIISLIFGIVVIVFSFNVG